MFKLSIRRSNLVEQSYPSIGVAAFRFLQTLVLVSTLLGQSLLFGQEKYDFKYEDYRKDVGKGFSVADELLASAARDKVSLAKIARIRWTAPQQDDRATVEQELEALVEFSEKHKATHRLLVVSKAQQEQLYEKFGVVGNPFAFLIDRKGRVRKSAGGSTQIEAKGFEEMINKLLDEN